MRSESQTKRPFRSVQKKLGPVEILIAYAGVYVAKEQSMAEMKLSQWNETLQSNLTATFLCFPEFLIGIKKVKIDVPSAVIIGSTAGVFGDSMHGDYAASKSALIHGFLKTVKNEIIHIVRHGRVNAISPTWTLTPLAKKFISERGSIKRALQRVPLRKLVRPSDVANLTVFLSSGKLAGHISGENIVLAGGMEGRMLFGPEEIDVRKS